MIKKILLVAAVIVFSFSIFLTSVLNVSAKTPGRFLVVKEAISRPTTAPTPIVKPEVKYYLPYPGILPDHPLYSLKMVRDRIWLWLTMNSSKKVELLLLFANKRIGAGKALVEGGKTDLGITTIEKGEKYLERAVEALDKMEEGKEVKSLASQIKQATLKHEEIILSLEEGLEGETKSALEKLLTYTKGVKERLDKLLGE